MCKQCVVDLFLEIDGKVIRDRCALSSMGQKLTGMATNGLAANLCNFPWQS